jgi:hypothetical protein
VAVGVTASVVFVCGSAVLNYRMGYASASNPLDGVVYGSLAAAGDGLKAVAPFGVAYAWRRRQWLAVPLAAALFVAFTLYSFTASLGFSAQHRAHKEGEAAASIEGHADRRAEIKRARARLEALGLQRGSGEVRQAIANLSAKPVGSGRWTVTQVSEACTKNKRLTQTPCADIAALKLELARAEEAERLVASLKALTDDAPDGPLVTTADAQTEALAFLGGRMIVLPQQNDGKDMARAGYALAVLMAVFIELGSGLGLYVATLPLRRRPGSLSAPLPSPSFPAIPHGPSVDMFVMERLQRRSGAGVTVSEAFESYKTWCEVRGKSMIGRTRFERGLVKLAREIGLDADCGLSGWVIRDVALRAECRRLAAKGIERKSRLIK